MTRLTRSNSNDATINATDNWSSKNEEKRLFNYTGGINEWKLMNFTPSSSPINSKILHKDNAKNASISFPDTLCKGEDAQSKNYQEVVIHVTDASNEK